MAFFGSEFIYDNVPSSLYGLFISSSSEGGEVDINTFSDVEILEDSVLRNPVPYFYGVRQNTKLQFEVAINAENPIDAVTSRTIIFWLRQLTYKNLQIAQSDLFDLTFHCIFTNIREHKVGNIIRGYKATAICDAPWGWGFPIDETITPSPPTLLFNHSHYNPTNNQDYTWPIITVTVGSGAGSGDPAQLLLTNLSDENFQASTLINLQSPGEIITVDHYRKIITSSLGVNRYASNFGKTWLRLLPGDNSIEVEYRNIDNFKIQYTPAIKVGG